MSTTRTTTEYEIIESYDGDDYEVEYEGNCRKNIHRMVTGRKTTQEERWEPYLGWRPIGDPVVEHDTAPMQLRDGFFVDMRQDPGFVKIVRES